MNEIERKFLVSKIPDVPVLNRYISERYLLSSDNGTEERITNIGDTYYHEQKRAISDLERTRDKRTITKKEFNELKSRAYGVLKRETFLISEKPKIIIQSYTGEYSGLYRAEIEFKNVEEANGFKPFEWMGKEITGTPIGRDSTLAKMNRNEMLAQL